MTRTRAGAAALIVAGLGALVAAAVVVFGVSFGRSGPAWISYNGANLEAEDGAVDLGAGIVARFGDGCAQVIVDGSPAPCIPLAPGASRVDTARFGDRRVVIAVQRPGEAGWNPEIPGVERIVTFSDVESSGRVEQVRLGPDGQRVAVWEMAAGEEPWGVQLLDADGGLVAAVDLVGLPGH